MAQKRITDIVLDFDGTCTRIPLLHAGFMRTYFECLSAVMSTLENPVTLTKQEWEDALDVIRKNSPMAGWTITGTPSAPAAADPYILAFEAQGYIFRQHQIVPAKLPCEQNRELQKIFDTAYNDNKPLWREDAADTFKALQDAGVRLHFISNTSTDKIRERLTKLTTKEPINVEGGAAKYSIRELNWDTSPQLPEDVQKIFHDLPASYESAHLKNPGRPMYLRRGSYFEAICRTLKNDMSKLETTVFCGDVWELDIAMPHRLGAPVHLMTRQKPFDTYEYELEIVKSYGTKAKIGDNLSDLLKWL